MRAERVRVPCGRISLEGMLELSQGARDALIACERKLTIVPSATHLFEEPGTLEDVARLAAEWFVRHLARPASLI